MEISVEQTVGVGRATENANSSDIFALENVDQKSYCTHELGIRVFRDKRIRYCRFH